MDNKNFKPECEECKAKCCKYIAVEIDKPTTKTDYDSIRWYLLHENINVFVEKDGCWYLEMKTLCKSLTKNNKCANYHNRPKI